jgi:arylsulfatase
MPLRRLGAWAARYAPLAEPFKNNLWHGDLGPARTARSRRGYYGSISFIDEQIGMVLAALERRGLLEKTLILFTADHGDMTGDHHLWRKSYPYEASSRIPFLVRWPESPGVGGARGVTIDRPVELRDVLPTFLDTAGAPAVEGLDGRSILPLLRGEGFVRDGRLVRRPERYLYSPHFPVAPASSMGHRGT